MSGKKQTLVYVVFENNICNVGSQLDGQDLYECLDWDETDVGSRLVAVVPRIGEVIEMQGICFEVLDIKHKARNNSDWNATYILVKQIPLNDARSKW